MSPETVRPLRGQLLRPGQSPEQLAFAGDEEPETLHVAITLAGSVAGVASVLREAHPRRPRPGDWRVRGMVTAPDARGRGLGAALLARCEAHARELGGTRLWCNARLGARAFYERAGLRVEGEPFEIPKIGAHLLMSKALASDPPGAPSRGQAAWRREIDWLISPDSFKGSHTASEVALALARGAGEEGQRIDVCPVADGGEGTLEILLGALGGWAVAARVQDPLGRERSASFGWTGERGLAIVASAEASGLSLVLAGERDAGRASTFGTGQLIAAAVALGARQVILAVGGLASTDGGSGAIEAIEAEGGLKGARLTVLADVSTPFERAAEVFAPQKGADEAGVKCLGGRLHALAERLPRDPRGIAMSGAGGGLAGGLWAMYGAELGAGAPFVLDAIGFERRLRRARAVITGESRLDAQTLAGKAVGEIAARCAASGKPMHAVVGSCTLSAAELTQLSPASVQVASSVGELESAARVLARKARAR